MSSKQPSHSFPESFHSLAHHTPQRPPSPGFNVEARSQKILAQTLEDLKALMAEAYNKSLPRKNEICNGIYEEFHCKNAEIADHSGRINQIFNLKKKSENRVRRAIDRGVGLSRNLRTLFRSFSALKANLREGKQAKKLGEFIRKRKRAEQRQRVFNGWRTLAASAAKRRGKGRALSSVLATSQAKHGRDIAGLKSRIEEIEREIERVDLAHSDLSFGLSQTLLKAMSALNNEVIDLQKEELGNVSGKTAQLRELEKEFANKFSLADFKEKLNK